MQNILVVDDDLSMRKLLVEYLSKHAFRASAVENSVQMNRHLSTHPPDLVIVDLNLGDEDGLEIVRKLNAQPDLPVIIISGDRMDETDKVVGLELGATDYITKPFGMREFLLASVWPCATGRSESRHPSAPSTPSTTGA